MQFLDELFRQRILRLRDNHVDALEVVYGFHNVIHIHGFPCDTDGIRFEDIARLIVGKTAALNVVGIIGQFDLQLMVDAAGDFCGLLCFHNIQQCFRYGSTGIYSVGLCGALRDIPCLAREECTGILFCAQ
jgi:hypothetical protein